VGKLIVALIIVALIVAAVIIYLIHSGLNRTKQELAEKKRELKYAERIADRATAGLMEISSGMAGNPQITAMAVIDEINNMKQEVEKR
jgi:predicted Holliday junction resolvase-like endonuclease